MLGRRKFHSFELNAMGRRCLGGLLSGIALVHKRHCGGCARDVLHLHPQLPDLGAVLFIRRCARRGQPMPEGVNRVMYRAATYTPPPIAGSVAAATAPWECGRGGRVVHSVLVASVGGTQMSGQWSATMRGNCRGCIEDR
jgi:hypothetical protein